MVSMAREQTSFAQARVVVVCLEPPPGRPLICTGDARRFIESQPVHTCIPVGISLSLTYNTSYTSGRFTAIDSKPTIGLGPSSAYTTNEVNPAQVGRFTPSGNIPNIRPQIDLNWFMSILHTILRLGCPLLIGKSPCRHHFWSL